jgi:hypothetical protein
VGAGLTASLSSMLAECGLAAAPAGQLPDLILRRVAADARSGNAVMRPSELFQQPVKVRINGFRLNLFRHQVERIG